WVQQAQGTSVADAGDGRSPVYPLLQSEQVHAGSDTGRQVRRKDIGTGRTARTAPVKRKEGGQEAPHYPRRSFATRSNYVPPLLWLMWCNNPKRGGTDRHEIHETA